MNTLLTMGLTGSASLLVWAILSRLAGERLPAAWHTAILRLALFLTLFPVSQFPALLSGLVEMVLSKLPGSVPDIPPAIPNPVVLPAAVSPATGNPVSTPILALSETILQGIVLLWTAGAVAMLLSRVRSYVRFRRLLSYCTSVENPETLAVFQQCRERVGVKRRVLLLSGPAFPTPMTTGLLRPAVILPDAPLSEEELRCVLLHEMTHIRNRDLWTRFFAMLSCCLHWWNPAVAILRRELQDWEERNCDEQVSRILDNGERRNYGMLLLRWAAVQPPSCGEWAASLSTGRVLKGRLERVIHPRTLAGRRTKLAVVLLAALVLVGAGTAAAQMPQIARADNPNPSRALTTQEQLILRRGGTLLPDTDPAAWYSSGMGQNTEWHKLYIDRDQVRRTVDLIGNADKLDEFQRRSLPELVNGVFPRNSKGETYGSEMLSEYVGYTPELERIQTGPNQVGYILRAELLAVPTDLPAEECPHVFPIPLYDSEHQIIGEYEVSCGGHIPVGITVEEAKALAALQMENESWQSVEEMREYLFQHWDENNKEEIT